MANKQNKDQDYPHIEPPQEPASPPPNDPLEGMSDLADQKVNDSTSASSTRPAAPSKKTDADPPRTTTGGWFTAPKFGSAGSGGAEIEPGPKQD